MKRMSFSSLPRPPLESVKTSDNNQNQAPQSPTFPSRKTLPVKKLSDVNQVSKDREVRFEASNSDNIYEENEDVPELAKNDKPQPSLRTGRGQEFKKASIEGLTKADNIFGEDLLVSEFGKRSDHTFIGFSTGRGKEVKLSKEAIERAKRILEDAETPQDSATDSTAVKAKNQPFHGFSTARGKEVKTSKEALEKAKIALEEVGVPKDSGKNNTAIKNQSLQGFSTARGKEVKTSSEALNKAKKILEDAEPKNDTVPSSVSNLSENKPVMGFSTGRGKEVKTSSEALEKAKKILEDSESLKDEPGNAFAHKGFSGFSSAGGAKLNLSNKAMEKAKALFQDDMIEDPLTSSKITGFSSAGGAKMNLSNKALEKAKALFQDDMIEDPKKSSKMAGFSFSSAKGSKFVISNDSMTKARAIFKDVDQDENDENKKKRKLDESEGEIGNKRACLSVSDDAFQDDFEVDTQMLLDVERNAFEKIRITPIKTGGCRMINVPKVDPEIARQRFQLRQKQQDQIKAKQVNQAYLPGSLLASKRNIKREVLKLKRLKINDLEDHALENGIEESTLNMTAETAKDHVFIGKRYFEETILTSQTSLTLGDNAQIVLNDACNVDFEVIANAFRTSPGVDPAKATSEWVENHYRWIVWKLATYERRFPLRCKNILHPHHVLLQLKYRYDLEIAGQSRSALKKIYEKDDIPSKCLVLVVADIVKTADFIFLELTDGWYSIGSKVTEDFGKVTTGTKIVTFGAELVNHDQASSPLEASPPDPDDKSCPLLKLHFNSTRRARWETKLGYHRFDTLPTSLSHLTGNGGAASELSLYFARKYPIVYTLENKQVVNQRKYDTMNFEQDLEKIYHDVQYEFEQRERSRQKTRRPSTRRSMSNKDIAKLTKGNEITDAIENSPEPGMIESLLSPAQVQAVHDYKRRQWEDLHAAMEKEVKERLKSRGEKATPMLKIAVVDAKSQTRGNLCIWRPNDELFHGLREQSLVKVFNATVVNVRDGVVNLKSTKQTKFKLMDRPKDLLFDCDRKLVGMEEILEDCFDPLFKEVDVMGVVIHIGNISRGFQAVHVCDAMFNFVCLQFWGGIDKFAYDSLIKLGSALLFSNLQWRKSSAHGSFFQSQNVPHLPTIPCLYVTEYTLISIDAKGSERSAMLKDLSEEVKKAADFLSQAKLRLAQLTTKVPSKPVTPSLPVMTPPTPATSSKSIPNNGFDPPLAKSPYQVVENSPVFYQSLRNKQRMATLEKFSGGGDPSVSITPVNTTPLPNRRGGKLRTPFKVPFIDRLKKAYE